ncbi:MAG TPA: SapC family protein [Steroidobacteraceae bacterium]|nr:SapC family protein [Steroidobacteraceae bacterium]
MTQHALLNNQQHHDLRVITAAGAAYGDDMMCAPTFPEEFRTVQAHYPIVFGKPRDGATMPLAVFGFREKQNLFLQGDRWDAYYLPLMVQRVPFLIGTGSNGKVVHIDLDSPRVSRTAGEPLFDAQGGNTGFLDRVSATLAAIDDGLAAIPAFVAALEEHNLLESFTLDISFRDGPQHRFAGFHTVQEDRLNQLSAAALGKLHQAGYLLPIYMVIASLSNFRALTERASQLNVADR